MRNILSKISKYIIIVLFLFSAKISLYSFAGLYVMPKISVYPYLPEYKTLKNSVYDYSIGYSIALGYDFGRLMPNRAFRVDLEYNGNISITQKKFRIDYLFVNAAYDINFYKKGEPDIFDRDALEVEEVIFNLYIGATFGLSVITEDTGVWYEKNTLVSATSHVYRKSIAGGVNAGFVVHIKNYFAIDFGYKWIVSPLIRDSHNVLLGFRFTLPKMI